VSAAGPGLVVVRGGGDLATGIVWRLTRAGWPVVVTELVEPLTVRRSVSVSSAVSQGLFVVEGMRAELAATPAQAWELARSGAVGVLVCEGLASFGSAVDDGAIARSTDRACAVGGTDVGVSAHATADVVVDARMAKRNIDTTINDAPLVVTIGPGFTAGVDCHAVVETQRGHRLGRCLWSGSAAPNTSVPGSVGGRDAERVLRAPVAGVVRWAVDIADTVAAGQTLGSVGGSGVAAPFDGVARGLIASGTTVRAGTKIGDIDPRGDPSACHEISDKSLAVGGGVVEAILTWMARR